MAKANFQNQVSPGLGQGLPGDKASLSLCVYSGANYLCGDSALNAGRFVWADPADNGSVKKALSTGQAGAQPLGLVQRVLANMGTEQGNILPGSPLSIIQHGDIYAVSSNDAQPDHKVFALLADGSLHCAEAESNVPNAVETGWSVRQGGAAGELITISNWSI